MKVHKIQGRSKKISTLYKTRQQDQKAHMSEELLDSLPQMTIALFCVLCVPLPHVWHIGLLSYLNNRCLLRTYYTKHKEIEVWYKKLCFQFPLNLNSDLKSLTNHILFHFLKLPNLMKFNENQLKIIKTLSPWTGVECGCVSTCVSLHISMHLSVCPMYLSVYLSILTHTHIYMYAWLRLPKNDNVLVLQRARETSLQAKSLNFIVSDRRIDCEYTKKSALPSHPTVCSASHNFPFPSSCSSCLLSLPLFAFNRESLCFSQKQASRRYPMF